MGALMTRIGAILARMDANDEALVAALLAQLRAEQGAQGLSVVELGRRVGIHRNVLDRYLKGDRPMPIGIFIDLCSSLGVSPDVLIGRARERMQR